MFFLNQEKILLSKTKLENSFPVEVLNILVWIRRKHENISLQIALNNYYSLGFAAYKKLRLKELQSVTLDQHQSLF